MKGIFVNKDWLLFWLHHCEHSIIYFEYSSAPSIFIFAEGFILECAEALEGAVAFGERYGVAVALLDDLSNALAY